MTEPLGFSVAEVGVPLQSPPNPACTAGTKSPTWLAGIMREQECVKASERWKRRKARRGEGDAGHVQKGEWNKEVGKTEGWKEGVLGDRGREGGKRSYSLKADQLHL